MRSTISTLLLLLGLGLFAGCSGSNSRSDAITGTDTTEDDAGGMTGGDDMGGGEDMDDDDDGSDPMPPPATIAASSSNHTLTSSAPREDDDTVPVTVTFSVFLPEHQVGDTVPLIVHSHGFGGSRVGTAEADADPAEDDGAQSTRSVFARLDDQVRLLWDAGYAVVSFDERGFGRGQDGDDGNSGAIQIMDPDFEIQDAISVLDWIDDPDNVINGVVVRDLITRDDTGNMIAGAIGGSYGGGYQLLLAALDDRLDAITPTATWYSLLQSLLPNEVIKKSYSTGLCALITTSMGESGTRTQSACDQAADTGSMGGAAARYRDDIRMQRDALEAAFRDHGMIEIERRHNEDADFTMRPIDTLLVQGNRDILFNLNQSFENYRFLNGLDGSDVRLMTMENGHSIRQTRMNPGSQGALGPSACGPLDSLDSVRAWFDLKLRGNAGAEALIPAEICLSLDDTTAVNLGTVPLASRSNTDFDSFEVTIPDTGITAQQSNVNGVDGGMFFPLGTAIAGDGFVLAGVPVAELTITAADALAEQNGGTTAFVGIGIQRGDETILVDDEVQPIRSAPQLMDTSGELPLVGIGENLLDGDVVGVLVYGNFDIYETGTGSIPTNFGANNRFSIAGSVRLPIIESAVVQRMP